MLSGFDQKHKTALEQEYEYSDLVKKTMVLGNYTLFDDISDKKNYVKICSDGNPELLDSIFYDEWVKKYCLQQIMNITVLGHEKRCCGKMISIPWVQESEEKGEVNTNENSKYSGGFLIKSVTHYFTNTSPAYYQKMSLIKNGFQYLDSLNSGAVLKQDNQEFRNSFDNNSFLTIDWNTYKRDTSSGLFNRATTLGNLASGLLRATENTVDTGSLLDKIKGWFK